MTSSVTGLGNLGSTLALKLAQMRHEVIGFDTDAAPMACWANCSGPSYSPSPRPGLARLLQGGHDGARPRFATDLAELAVAESKAPRVGTPLSEATHDPHLWFPVSANEALLPPLASKLRRAAV
jgi:UDP-N-acetyl-D-mannosaminuronate dehydrogenase